MHHAPGSLSSSSGTALPALTPHQLSARATASTASRAVPRRGRMHGRRRHGGAPPAGNMSDANARGRSECDRGGGGYEDLRELPTFTYAARLRLSRAGRGAVPNPARGGVGSLVVTPPQCRTRSATLRKRPVSALSFMSAVMLQRGLPELQAVATGYELHQARHCLHMHAEKVHVSSERVWGTGQDRCTYVSTSWMPPIRPCLRCTDPAPCTQHIYC